MRLKNVAKMFDTCPVYDGYTGAFLFKVQSSTFLESAVEGSTAARRTMSVAPGIVFPAHRVVSLLDQHVVVGHSNPDEWKGEEIRSTYWTKVVTDSFQLLTPKQALAGTTVPVTLGQKKFLKESPNSTNEAEIDPVWEIYISKSLAPARGMILKSGTTLYRVRVSYEDVDGFRTCQSDELDTPVVTASLVRNAYDPIQDAYTAQNVSSPVLFVDYYRAYDRQTPANPAFQAGDELAILRDDSGCFVGQQIVVPSGHRYAGVWTVLNLWDELDSLVTHVRRVT